VIPESAVVNERSDEAAIAELLERLHSRRVEPISVNVGGGDLRTPEGRDRTARRLQFARDVLRASIAVTSVGQPADGLERAAVVANLRSLGELAGGLAMGLSLETHRGPTQNAEAMLALIAEVGHPAVRINFDTGNVLYYNQGCDVVAELEKVAPLVASVHAKDSRGAFEEWYFPALGDGGAVDFRRVRAVLDAVGFPGPYTIEIEGIGGEPEPGLETRRDRVARSVAHLRSCGYFDD
jgi:inosose dehydratase